MAGGRWLLGTLLVVALAGCEEAAQPCVQQDWYRDADLDGFGVLDDRVKRCTAPEGYVDRAGDCDDDAAAVHPDRTEVCNDLDDDCDGAIDQGLVQTWYLDRDADGWGDDASAFEACDPPQSAVDRGGDCDDLWAAIQPGAPEACDGLDNDCDGLIDEDAPATTPFWPDLDGDGHGAITEPVLACAAPPGHVEVSGDCDDTDPAREPGAPELCDGIDNDCDELIDTDDPVLAESIWVHRDNDGDGYGDASAPQLGCPGPDWLEDGSDCDDGDAAVSPDAAEACNGFDDDCDGAADDADTDAVPVGALIWYADRDLDGWGDATSWLEACYPLVPWTAEVAGDCDDYRRDVHPDGTEVCDGDDNDCNGLTDDDDPGLDLEDVPLWYGDGDGDGYGDPEAAVQQCSAPPGTVDNDVDCDDAASEVHPWATEVCNGRDDNCDALADDGDPALDPSTRWAWYRDGDGDGWGDAAAAVASCIAPPFHVHNDLDCDDRDPALGPPGDWLYDGDDDGFGAGFAVGPPGCVPPSPEHVPQALGIDCNDGDPAIHPAAAEVCGDGVDDNCSGMDAVCHPTLGGEAGLDDVGVAMLGEGVDDQAGYAVAGAGDVDGDGFGDLIVGAPHYGPIGDTHPGVAYLMRGPIYGDRGLADADVQLWGESGALHTGASVSAAGDTNGDGFDDLVVGAPDAPDAGAAYVVHGPIAGDTVDLAHADAAYAGDATGDHAGRAVSDAGDANGDGYTDLIVGASGAASGDGAAYLILGPASGTGDLSHADALLTGESGSAAGVNVGGAGDVNGDGLHDLVVGADAYDDPALADAGAVHLIVGPVSGTLRLADATATLVGEDADDHAGRAVCGGGDVDGDGLADLVVGSGNGEGGVEAGAAYVVSGLVRGRLGLSDAGGKLVGEQAHDEAGWAVSHVGDLDGDGFDDVVVGAPGAGAAYLVRGPVLGTVDLAAAEVTLVGEVHGDDAGWAVAGAGDLDVDGFPDILIGVPQQGDAGPSAGAAYLVYGGAL